MPKDSGDGKAPHCKWCSALIRTENFHRFPPTVWAAWIAGYCSPYHQAMGAKDTVERSEAWWQDNNASRR